MHRDVMDRLASRPKKKEGDHPILVVERGKHEQEYVFALILIL